MNITRIAVLAACLGVAVASRAGIMFDKCQNVSESPNFWYAKQEASNTTILAFNEKQGIRVEKGIIQVQKLNKWDDVKNLDDVKVGDGLVDSHMIYFQMTDSKERRTLVAEIEFDAPLIGFLADNELFEATNAMFAPEPTHKKAVGPGVGKWSLEEKASWTPLDEVTVLSPTRIRVTFSNHSMTDPLRVLTLRKATTRPATVPATQAVR